MILGNDGRKPSSFFGLVSQRLPTFIFRKVFKYRRLWLYLLYNQLIKEIENALGFKFTEEQLNILNNIKSE